MAQIKSGFVSVTNGSLTVIGDADCDWSDVESGHIFTILGSDIWFQVQSAQFVTDHWELTLSGVYTGTTGAGKSYAITTSFTPNANIAYPERGDVETASLFKRAMLSIDSLLTAGQLQADSRRSIAVLLDPNVGDVYGMEQVSAAQSGDAKALRLFTSSAASSYIGFGKYTSATAFTEFARFTNAGQFQAKAGIAVTGGITASTNATQDIGAAAARFRTVYATGLQDGTDQLVGSTGTTVLIGAGASWTQTALYTGGAVRLSVNGTATTVAGNLAVSGTGTSTIAGTLDAGALRVSATGATNKDISFVSDGVQRMNFRLDPGEASFRFTSRTSAGAVIDHPIQLVTAAGGELTLGRNTTITGNLTVSGAGTSFFGGVGNQSADSRLIINTGDANTYALKLSNWKGSATSYAPRIAFDNSTRSVWEIGPVNGGSSFSVYEVLTATTPITITNSGYTFFGSLRLKGGDAAATIWQQSGNMGIYAEAGTLTLQGTGGTTAVGGVLSLATANTTSAANDIYFGGNSRARVRGIVEDSATGADGLRFMTGNSTSGSTVQMQIANNGFVTTAGRLGVGSLSGSPIGLSGGEIMYVIGDTRTDGTGVYPVTATFIDSRAYNATGPQPGGGIGFAFKYNAAGNYALGSSIQGFKENSTDGNYASGLRFLTRGNGLSPSVALTLGSDASATFAGLIQNSIGGSSVYASFNSTASDARMEFRGSGTRMGLIGWNADNFLFQSDNGRGVALVTAGVSRLTISNAGVVSFGAAIWHKLGTTNLFYGASNGTNFLGMGTGQSLRINNGADSATIVYVYDGDASTSYVHVASTKASTATNNGALVVSGGIGASGAGCFGGGVLVGGNNSLISMYGSNSANTKSTIQANGGVSSNYNGVQITANMDSAGAQANAVLPSWAVDIGGSNGPTFGTDQFAVLRAPAGSTTFAKLMSVASTGAVTVTNSAASSFSGELNASNTVFMQNGRVGVNNSSVLANTVLDIRSTASRSGVYIGGSVSRPAWLTSGAYLEVSPGTITDNSTAASGAVNSAVAVSFSAPTVNSTNTNVYMDCIATVAINGDPVRGANVTASSPTVGFWNAGTSRFDKAIGVYGSSTGGINFAGSWGNFVFTLRAEADLQSRLCFYDSGGLKVAHIGSRTGGLQAAWGTTGVFFHVAGRTQADTSSAAGTVATAVFNSFHAPGLTSSNAVTYTDAATVYIGGGPFAGTNAAITNGWALWANGSAKFNGFVQNQATSGGSWAIFQTRPADAAGSSVIQFATAAAPAGSTPTWSVGHRFNAHGALAFWRYNGAHQNNDLTIGTDGVVTIASNAASTNSGNGALVVTGGIGAGGDVCCSHVLAQSSSGAAAFFGLQSGGSFTHNANAIFTGQADNTNTGAANLLLTGFRTGDTSRRFTITMDGLVSWSAGNAVADTFLQRTSAGVLTLGTDSSATPAIIVNAAAGTAQGGTFAVKSVGSYKSAFGCRASIIGSGTDQSAMLQSYADNLYLNVATAGKGIMLQTASVTRMTIADTGISTTGKFSAGGNIGLNGRASLESSTNTINVGTTATSVMLLDAVTGGAMIFVSGSNIGTGAKFADIIMTSGVTGEGVVVVSSGTIAGSPPARTYSVNAGQIRVALASGTMNVSAVALCTGSNV